MDEAANKRFEWRLVVYGALAGVILLLPTMTMGNGIGAFLFSGILAVIIAVAMLVVASLRIRRHPLATLSMLAMFVVVSFLLFTVSDLVRSTGRWIFQSSKYKAAVLAQPESPGELKHVEWDGWGFAGTDTFVYVVFDPKDALIAAKMNSSDKYSGIPCEVWKVHRLEKHWYTVTFYTNTNWEYCGG